MSDAYTVAYRCGICGATHDHQGVCDTCVSQRDVRWEAKKYAQEAYDRAYDEYVGKVARTEAFPITITDGEPSDLPDCWQPQQRTATVIVGYDENDEAVGSIRVFDQ